MTPKRKSYGSKSRDSAFRREAYIEPRDYVLIVCEGAKTEPGYLDSLRRTLRLNSRRVEIVPGDICGSHPTSVVKYAKDRMAEIKRQGIVIEPHNVWCVFDHDDHARLHDAMTMARDNKFSVAFSNPRFELWFLLHFIDQSAHISKAETGRRLRQPDCIPRYSKNMDVFSLIQNRTDEAIKRAKALRKQHKSAGSAETDNPSTSVDRLVAFLRKCSKR